MPLHRWLRRNDKTPAALVSAAVSRCLTRGLRDIVDALLERRGFSLFAPA